VVAPGVLLLITAQLGPYQSLRAEGRAAVLTASSGAELRVTPYGEFILRVQAARPGESFPAERSPDMVERHDRPGALDVGDFADRVELETSALNLVVRKADMTFDLLLNGEARLSGGRTSFAGARTSQAFAPIAGEHFAGLGHGYFGRVPKLDLAGTTQVRTYGRMHGDQAPLIVPFYLSSRGYGIFVNAAADVTFDFAANAFAIDGGPLDFFVIGGPKLYDVLDRYTELTGRPRLPPRAVFGLALSDKGHPLESDASWWQRRVVEHRALGLPLDHLVNDNRWRAGGGERCVSRFDWDPVRYPDPAAFEDWLTREGLIATLDFNRCIASQSEGWQADFNLPGTQTVEFGDSSPDLSRDDVRSWWWDLIFAKAADPALDYPHDALWIDEFDELGLVSADTVIGNGQRWGETRNLWFLSIAEALGTDGWNRDIGEAQRPFIWVRGMTAGGQRNATLWSGDLASTYDEMRLQIRGLQAAGLSGFPFWGHDAGGFNAEGIDEATFDLLYRQWALAFGSFTPYWRPHGVGPLRWPMDRSPQSLFHAQLYGDLRMALMPYLDRYAYEAAARGAPIARPLFLEYGDDDRAWAYDLEYLWGRELLIAPVTGPGDAMVDVFLPQFPGGGWYDFWSDALHAAGRVIQTYAPAGRMPIFVRAGAILPMAPPADATAFVRSDVLDLHVYTGVDGAFALVETDGVTERYRSGAVRTTSIAWSQTEKTLRIGAASGTFDGAATARRYRVWLHGAGTPPCVELDGTARPTFHSLRDAEAHRGGAFPMGMVTGSIEVDREALIRFGSGCTSDPVLRYQAESARTNGTVDRKPTASGGAYVGGLDAAGAFVEIDVNAAAAGERELSIGYANGTTEWASRALSVNGVHVADPVFPPTADWWRFQKLASMTVALSTGTNTLRLETGAGDRSTLDVDFFEIHDGPPSPGAPFEMQDGLLAVEAEHYHRTVMLGGHAWVPITRPHGYADDGALIALPDVEVLREDRGGPRVEWDVEVEQAGTYNLWIRGHAYGDGDDDSVHTGDGTVSFTDAADWTWARGTIALSAGANTISLWMREDGAILDRFVLTLDASFVPEGEGPPESPRVGDPKPPPPDAGVPDVFEPPRDAGSTDATDPIDDEKCACTETRAMGSATEMLFAIALAWILRKITRGIDTRLAEMEARDPFLPRRIDVLEEKVARIEEELEIEE
jgi:alpha-glucosidase (family GH31 glycosyl hydrolase)